MYCVLHRKIIERVQINLSSLQGSSICWQKAVRRRLSRKLFEERIWIENYGRSEGSQVSFITPPQNSRNSD